MEEACAKFPLLAFVSSAILWPSVRARSRSSRCREEESAETKDLQAQRGRQCKDQHHNNLFHQGQRALCFSCLRLLSAPKRQGQGDSLAAVVGQFRV